MELVEEVRQTSKILFLIHIAGKILSPQDRDTAMMILVYNMIFKYLITYLTTEYAMEMRQKWYQVISTSI